MHEKERHNEINIRIATGATEKHKFYWTVYSQFETMLSIVVRMNHCVHARIVTDNGIINSTPS